METGKFCRDCKHVRFFAALQDGVGKATEPSCSQGGRSPVTGEFYPCKEVRMSFVVGYGSDGNLTGLISCAPVGHWWEPR